MQKLSKARSRLNSKVKLIIASILIALLLPALHPIQQLDRYFQDRLILQRAKQQQVDPRIVVIDIDENSLKAMTPIAGRWPWPRSIHAELLAYLRDAGASAIIFDILFAETDTYRPQHDAYFIEEVLATPTAYLPSLHQPADNNDSGQLASAYPSSLWLSKGKNEQSHARILTPSIIPSDKWHTGTINFSPDNDGIGRRYDVYRQIDDWKLISLPTRVALDMGVDVDLSNKDFVIDWQSPSSTPHPVLAYGAVYREASDGLPAVAPGYFKDKIIIVGSTASGLHDFRSTPINHTFPGVFILTTAIDNLLNGERLEFVSRFWQNSLAIILIGLASIPLLRQRLTHSFIAVFATALVLFSSAYVAILQGLIFNISSGLIALTFLLLSNLLHEYFSRKRQLQHTIKVFERVMDPKVVKQLVTEHDKQELLANKNCNITVLFSDIRNFTSMSEAHTADEIMKMLNLYFTRQVEVIFKHGGTLDKFIGDAVMAFWGAPLNTEEQEKKAINAALEMMENMESFKQEFGYPDFDIGIGVHSGEAVVGLLGSAQRSDYTAMGDTVNLASRIESLTKNVARILVSEDTVKGCQDSFCFQDHGQFQVKGREQAVRVYEPRRK